MNSKITIQKMFVPWQFPAWEFLRTLCLLCLMVVAGAVEAQTTYKYYALHANGKGYMKQRYAAVANDGTFRSDNVYDANGYSIWVYSSEGYLTNDMYYLCEANGTLILSDKPSTKWELVTDGDRQRLQKEGTTQIVGLNSGGTPVLDEPTNLANKYAVCEMTVEENNGKWEGPKDVSYTVRSPQLVTFMRVYYIHNITATILKDDANKTNQKVVDKKDSRIFQRLKFKSTTDGNRGTSWDIDETNAVIYNKQASGDVTVKATYTLTSCDPIAANNHPAVDVDVTLKIQPAALTPDPAKNYLLFYTKEANYRFPYATNEMNEGDAVNPQGKKDVLADPDIAPNNQISWKVEVDAEGFVSFKNIETNRYVYYDASDFTLGSNYGVVKIGDTSLPSGDNRYKFRIYQPANHGSYGVCQTIIPYDLQFVVGRSDGDNGIINDGICCAWYVNKDQNIISLGKGNGDSKWKIYAYEAENRLKSDWTLNGPNTASETGTYNFTATTFYSRNIVGSPANNRDLEIVKTYTKLPVKYKWTVTGINNYITTTDNSSNGDGKLAVAVNSMPVSNTIGAVKCEAYVDAGTYTLKVDGVTREFSVSKKLSNNKTVTFNLYPLSIVPTSFTEISSLSQITDAAGYYKLTADCSDNVSDAITVFTGWLDGDNHTISGLSAPLFAKMSGAAVVRNLMLQNVNISSSGKVGAIASEADGNARIYNVGILSGSVGSSDDYCGGIVGLIDGSARVINCFSYANITGGTYVGGIVGYNNYATTSVNAMTMVMNCMFYGNATGSNVAPVYNGQIINNNSNTGLNNFNYFSFEDFTSTINTYNCALGAEKRFLERFEFYRQILNSNRELAAWYVTGSVANARTVMAKWVLDKTVKPYPILKPQGQYPSIINYDDTNLEELGTLSVTVSAGSGAPSGASIITNSLSLKRTPKDPDNFNFNYDKVQLPYYNDIGTGNYTDNKVVVGWEITAITGGGTTTYSTGTDVTVDGEGKVTATPYNFADRNCTAKDLYATSGRVFSQGAYFDVPTGVTAITIQPHWAKAAYLSDPNYDKTYTNNYAGTDIKAMGTRYNNKQNYTINGSSQMVYTNMGDAITGLGRSNNSSVYDYAVVLVGNYHHYYGDSQIKDDNNGFTIMSADLDGDNEPDNCFIYQHTNRRPVSPIRFDFLCWSGIGMAQKPSNSPRMPDIGIFKPRGWFEVTNTCLAHFYQFEYDWGTKNADKDGSPLILLGGIYEQIVSSNDGAPTHTKYIHLGSNAWFKMFNNGIHADKDFFTPHKPISVTGGDYDLFYLSGMFKPSATVNADNAECYITGGRFGEVAGAGQEQINGDVYWQIDRADITDFYGGGINDAKPVKGNITIDITNSNVTRYCGGPKFGNMSEGKVVTTTAENCTFGKYFGAGYGGTSLNKVRKRNYTNSVNYNFNEWATHANHGYKRQYETTTSLGGNVNGDPNSTVTVNAISTNYEYELFPYSGFANNNNVGRFYVNYASLSLAATNDVNSTLTGCTIEEDFFGGGNLGKVAGNVTSTLTNCTVKGNVYGAGFAAIAPKVPVMPKQGFVTEPHYDGNSGTYSAGIYPATTDYTWHYTSNTISTGNEFDETNHLIYTNVNFPAEGGTVTGNVTLNIGGTTTVSGDVYGGGALASSNTGTDKTTTVNLTGGTINGSVYGGGMGDNETGPTVGNTQVNLNGTKTTTTLEGKEVTSYNDQCVVLGSIFGCNNINGTPKGNATVHIYKTWGTSRTSNENLNDIDDSKHSYHLQAVYGGGNLAAYDPDTPDTKLAKVIIDGCDLTSIKTVYGGGNAASTPATQVDVNGTYEIEEVFGGGNGKDKISRDGGFTYIDNPGANVGYRDYSDYETSDDADNGAATKELREQNYSYGTGAANVNIYGGLVHRVYGGSNTKGNVRQVAVTMLDNNTDCDFKVDEAYGGGKSAPMDGAANLVMACIPGLKAAYGGAENANINDNVTLNITNGTFERVFGGNNVAGTISGTITVNIEETGCKPIIIGQLYGGGNQAAYTGPLKAGSGAERQGPTVNVRSFTSIGDVFGGGYGQTAVVTGDTYVNINEVNGKYYAQATPAGSTGNKQYKFTQFKRVKPTTDNPEGYVYNAETGERETEEVTIDVYLPPHAANAMGAINNVYGGGNAAKVIGNTYVNIGTEATINFVTKKDGETTPATGVAVQGADIRGNVYGGGNQAEVTGDTHVQIGKKVEP